MMNKLWFRLTLGNTVIILVALLILGGVHSRLLSDYAEAVRRQELVELAGEINEWMGAYLAGELEEATAQNLLQTLDRVGDVRLEVMSFGGSRVLQSRGMRGRHAMMSQEAGLLDRVRDGELVSFRGVDADSEEEMLTVVHPVLRQGTVVGALSLSAPTRGIAAGVYAVLRLLALGGLVALLAAGAMGLVWSRRLTRPLELIAASATRMAQGDFRGRVPIEGPEEVEALSRAFNHLSASLSETLTHLRMEKDKLQATVTGMTEGVMGIDAAGDVFLLNAEAQRALQLPSSVIGTSVTVLDLPQSLRVAIEAVGSGNSARSWRLRLVDDRMYEVKLAPIAAGHADDAARGVVLLLTDVSEAEALEEMRRTFVANVSHELRTPLTAITGFLEGILDGTIAPERQDRYLHLMRQEVARLNRLIADLLDLSRLESARVALDYQSFDMGLLLRQVAEKWQPLAERQQVKLEVDLPDFRPMAWGDRDRLEQVVMNLMDNALRHSPVDSTVSLSLRVDDLEGLVSVQDQGPGIPEEERQGIWDRFHKVDRARRRDTAGTGLGLAIARSIIELHGRSIWVDSPAEGGSSFSFRFSWAPVSQ